MKKIIPLLLFATPAAFGQTYYVPYGQDFTFGLVLYDATDGTTPEGAVTIEDGDVLHLCDSTEDAAVGSDLTINDNGTIWDVTIAAADLQCQNATLLFYDSGDAWLSRDINFITVGHPSSAIPCWEDSCVTSGTAQASTSSTIVLAAATSISDDYLIGTTVCIIDGTGADQCRVASDYVNSTDTITVSENWTTTPSTDSDYIVYRSRFATISVDSNGRVDVGSIGGTAQTANDVGGDVNSILADTGTDGVLVAAAAVTTIWDESGIVFVTGTCDSGGAATCVDALRTEADDYWNYGTALIVQFSGGSEVRCIRDFIASSDTITVSPSFSQAVSTENYRIISEPTCRNYP